MMRNDLELHTNEYNAVQSALGQHLMRILIADDHDLVRETIALFLENEGLSEVLTAGSLSEAESIADAHGNFDLIILDYNMPGMDGLNGLTRIKKANDGRPVAIISGTATPAIAAEAIAAGAAGFIPKTLGSKSIVSAIRFMAEGEVYLPFGYMQQAEEKKVGNLTERETEVLRGLSKGLSNKEIARELDLREVTIKLHVKTLCRKLDARNRTQAAMTARDRKLI